MTRYRIEFFVHFERIYICRNKSEYFDLFYLDQERWENKLNFEEHDNLLNSYEWFVLLAPNRDVDESFIIARNGVLRSITPTRNNSQNNWEFRNTLE